MPQRPISPLASCFGRDSSIVVALRGFFVHCVHPTELYLSLTASGSIGQLLFCPCFVAWALPNPLATRCIRGALCCACCPPLQWQLCTRPPLRYQTLIRCSRESGPTHHSPKWIGQKFVRPSSDDAHHSAIAQGSWNHQCTLPLRALVLVSAECTLCTPQGTRGTTRRLHDAETVLKHAAALQNFPSDRWCLLPPPPKKKTTPPQKTSHPSNDPESTGPIEHKRPTGKHRRQGSRAGC